MTGKYLKRIIDGVPTAVVVIDKNLKAVFSNTAFQGLFPFKKSHSLGEITCCVHAASHCGGDDCRGCQLKDAFCDARLSQKQVNRRIFQKVINDEVCHDVSYSLTVKPLGGDLYMGIIDDAFELEIAQ